MNFGMSSGVTIQAAVRTGQIITFALTKGVIFFAVIALFLSWGNDAGPGELRDDAAAVAPGDLIDGLLPLIGVAAFVVASFAGAIAPAVMRSWAVHDFQQAGQQLPMSIDAETPLSHAARRLVTRLMAATLVSQAIFEGAGVINLVLLMVTGQIFLLVLAIFAVFAIVAQCPTRAKVLDRLESLARVQQ